MENYVLMAKEPVTSVAHLDGLKIGAPEPAVNWMAGTGAVGVASNITTYSNGLQTGVFEGVIVVPTAAAAAARLHEIAPHVTITDFGSQYAVSIVANRDWLQDRPAPAQDAMRAGAAAFTSGFVEEQTQRVDAAMPMISDENPDMIHELSEAGKLRRPSGLSDIAGIWAEAAKAHCFGGGAVLNAYMAVIQLARTELPRDWARN